MTDRRDEIGPPPPSPHPPAPDRPAWARPPSHLHPAAVGLALDHEGTSAVTSLVWHRAVLEEGLGFMRELSWYTTAKTLEPLGTPSPEEARREGFDSPAEFDEAFAKINARAKPGRAPKVWRVEFGAILPA